VQKVTQLNIYPVKSLGGISVQEAYAGVRGFRYDRSWMITGTDHVFITQREIPAMALIGTSFTEKGILLFMKKQPENNFLIPYVAEGKSVRAQIWNDQVNAVQYIEGNEWISEALKNHCHLLYMPLDAPRPVDPDYAVNHEDVSLADAFPYLLLGESSLADLNTRLADPLPMNRFRPNIVFAPGDAYEEDDWTDFSVNEVQFRTMKPCARCAITTVNQDTAEKGVEPLRTLAQYRSRNNKVLFGMNVLALTTGVIHVGDHIIRKRHQH
jgi:uncharacterized protein